MGEVPLTDDEIEYIINNKAAIKKEKEKLYKIMDQREKLFQSLMDELYAGQSRDAMIFDIETNGVKGIRDGFRAITGEDPFADDEIEHWLELNIFDWDYQIEQPGFTDAAIDAIDSVADEKPPKPTLH